MRHKVHTIQSLFNYKSAQNKIVKSSPSII